MSWETISEGVGLWLAEGDSKTTQEITFTNSEPKLIKTFYELLYELFPSYSNRIRLYVYSASGSEQPFNISPPTIKLYSDIRATRPYGIVRLTSVDCRIAWQYFVDTVKKYQRLHPAILRGIFAGEGSIQFDGLGRRIIRLAQLRSSLIEWLFSSCGFQFNYSSNNRTYEISRRNQWDLANSLNLCSLHPQKHEQFVLAYKTFQQYHYPKGYLKSCVEQELIFPCTTRFLAKKYSRSPARIYDILYELQAEDKIQKYGVGSTVYWILSSQEVVILSGKNNAVLQLVEAGFQEVPEMVRYLNVGHKTIRKHLRKLTRFGIVRQDENNKWKRLPTKKRIIVLY